MIILKVSGQGGGNNKQKRSPLPLGTSPTPLYISIVPTLPPTLLYSYIIVPYMTVAQGRCARPLNRNLYEGRKELNGSDEHKHQIIKFEKALNGPIEGVLSIRWCRAGLGQDGRPGRVRDRVTVGSSKGTGVEVYCLYGRQSVLVLVFTQWGRESS